jgi:hypothetical protein
MHGKDTPASTKRQKLSATHTSEATHFYVSGQEYPTSIKNNYAPRKQLEDSDFAPFIELLCRSKGVDSCVFVSACVGDFVHKSLPMTPSDVHRYIRAQIGKCTTIPHIRNPNCFYLIPYHVIE